MHQVFFFFFLKLFLFLQKIAFTVVNKIFFRNIFFYSVHRLYMLWNFFLFCTTDSKRSGLSSFYFFFPSLSIWYVVNLKTSSVRWGLIHFVAILQFIHSSFTYKWLRALTSAMIRAFLPSNDSVLFSISLFTL